VSPDAEPAASINARIVALTALADEAPEVDEVAPYLADAHPGVRRAAIEVLTESAPPDVALALTGRLADEDSEVRVAAIEALFELREVIDPDEALATALTLHEASDDDTVRAAVTKLRWEHRIGDLSDYLRTLDDLAASVRKEAVAGLVSLDATSELAARRADQDPLVRLAVARGLATVGDPTAVASLDDLAADEDLRVQAAAVEAYASLGVPPSSLPVVLEAADAAAWQLRKAAATALGAADDDEATAILLVLVTDDHIDVRKPAVQSLAGRAGAREDVRAALAAALQDPDADVRAHARLALTRN
jgi:HEAT repeat protein